MKIRRDGQDGQDGTVTNVWDTDPFRLLQE